MGEKISKCPVCGSEKLHKFRRYYICDDCGAKVGMSNGKIWYEYTLKSESDIGDERKN